MDREYYEGWWKAVYCLLYRPDPEAIRVVMAALRKLEGRGGKMVMPDVSPASPVRDSNGDVLCPRCGGQLVYTELGYGQSWNPSHDRDKDGPLVWMTGGEMDYDCDGPQAFQCTGNNCNYMYVPVWDTEPDGKMEWC